MGGPEASAWESIGDAYSELAVLFGALTRRGGGLEPRFLELAKYAYVNFVRVSLTRSQV